MKKAHAEEPAAATGPPQKKAKADDGAGPSPASNGACNGRASNGLLQPGVVNDALLASKGELRKQYQQAEPYKHCVMKEVFNTDLLRAVRDEIINNIQATYKETDLFKVFQTGDLANLDKLDPETAAKLPALYKLKDALYSKDFREFVTEVTGCGHLSDRTDTSCNVYAHGGHLLVHDDVIGSRRVSWIIYLTDPDDPWVEADGGALELYPLVAGEGAPQPSTDPSVAHLPTWNTMAMFTVLPGKSFHSVQEVFAGDKPRMSISGWYHSDIVPEDAQHASLQQLQLRRGEDAKAQHAPLEGGAGALSDDDLSLLVRYVNPAYLAEGAWPKILAKFKEEGSIELRAFLKKGLADKITAACIAEDKADQLGGGQVPSQRYEAGVRDGWARVGPSHKQRHLAYSGEGASAGSAAALLQQVRSELFGSGAFARLLKAMTTITFLGQAGEVRRFRPGMDYTVAHYGILTQDPRLDAVLCFVDDTTQESAAAWEVGEVGGFEAYLLADEDEAAAAAEVYRVKNQEEESGVMNIAAASNTLSLVLRDEGLMRFLKYISADAPGSRWDIAMEFLPEDDDDEEADEEEGGEGEGEGEEDKAAEEAAGGDE